jgi:hypothetical protein
LDFVSSLSERRRIFDSLSALDVEGLSIGIDGIVLYHDIQRQIGNEGPFQLSFPEKLLLGQSEASFSRSEVAPSGDFPGFVGPF